MSLKRALVMYCVIAVAILSMMGCTAHDSDVVSKNISTEADQFNINRRIVFYNGITGEYMLVIEGFCALGNDDPAWALTVVCRTGPDQYKKSFLGLSDNVTYFVEQVDSVNVSKYHYVVIFKPETIIPDIDHS